jgi:iron complex transport system substrate-binding protein
MTALPHRIGLVVPTVLVVSALALAGCSSSNNTEESAPSAGTHGYPVDVSSCAREVTVTDTPSRVVLGYHGTLDTLDALGASDSVYGYLLGPDDTGTPRGLPAGLVEVSSDPIPAREPIIAAQPDLFLANNEAQLTGQGTLSYDDLADSGSNAYVLGAYCAQNPDNATIDTVYTDINNLGRIFNVPDRADNLNNQLRQRVAAAKQTLNGSAATVAFLKIYGGKVYAIGGYPAAPVLAALGLNNQFADLSTPFAELSAEQAVAMTPDVVFVNYVGDEDAAIAAARDALPDVPAVADGRIYGADESDAQGGGVGVIEQLEAIAADVAIANQ